jgi:hypothetical protein
VIPPPQSLPPLAGQALLVKEEEVKHSEELITINEQRATINKQLTTNN